MISQIAKNHSIAVNTTATFTALKKRFNTVRIQADSTGILAAAASIHIRIFTPTKTYFSDTLLRFTEISEDILNGAPSSAHTVHACVDFGNCVVDGGVLTVTISSTFATATAFDVIIESGISRVLPGYRYRATSEQSFKAVNCDLIICHSTANDEHSGAVEITGENSENIAISAGCVRYNTQPGIKAISTTKSLIYIGNPQNMDVRIDDAGGNAITSMVREVINMPVSTDQPTSPVKQIRRRVANLEQGTFRG